MGKKAYQVRDIGKPQSEVWNEKKGATCAEWAASPKGRQVIELDLASQTERVLTSDEAQHEAGVYKGLAAS